MTDIQNINGGAITTTTPTVNLSLPTTPNTYVPPSAILETATTEVFVLRAPDHANSKLILQNMEEVLHSVKQKHREKHKRKREQKRRAALLGEAAEEGQSKSDNSHMQVDDKPQPLREKIARNGENVKKKPTRKSNHMKCNSLENNTQNLSSLSDLQTNNLQSPSTIKMIGSVSTPKATNVFEFMMNARNRSIGSNAQGQELLDSPTTTTTADTTESPTPLAKRKQMLQDWNERKGGAKRRLADEQRVEYIEHEMEQRAKRLKKMLTNPTMKTTKTETISTDALSSSAPTIPNKRSRGRPRTRRLSSVDSKDIVDVVTVEDAETVEFLSKLSSPTKKRDSLLGYFPKVESPKESADKVEPPSAATSSSETPKRRTRRVNNNETETAAPATPIQVVEVEQTRPQSSARPRRSCKGKARYDYDLEESQSPTKSKDMVAKAKDAEVVIDIIDLDNSNPATTPKKLAPVFMRHVPKCSPDPLVLKARDEFLRSGVPDKIKQEQMRQKQFEQNYEDTFEVFPRIAHVLQSDALGQSVTLSPLSWKLRAVVEDVPTLNRSKSKSNATIINITNCSEQDFRLRSQHKPTLNFIPLPVLEDKRGIVKMWKNEFDRFPTFKCYNQMREKYRYFSAIDSEQDTQQVGESFVVTRRTRRSLEAQKKIDSQSVDDDKPPAMAPNGELLFTEKYKPLLFEQVLVNLTPVQQLREFLSNWTSTSNRNSQAVDDVSFDFGNDSNSMGTSSNTMVLLGPCSSGKTNAVFALANDMNFNVLEINAGMKRTGKKLIQELQEATQSHQIRKDSKSGATAGSAQQQLLKQMSINGLKAKRQQGELPENAETHELSQSVRKSLILIEDADILFENFDAGFADAIYTLAASSKRPVIVVASDPNCAHLQRLMQQNIIQFHSPNVLNISKFLAVLALMENCPAQLDDLISLYLYNNKNLRKTLMELQFYIQSGGDHMKANTKGSPKSPRMAAIDGLYIHRQLFDFYTCAQNSEERIPFPVDFDLLHTNLTDLLLASPHLQPQSTEGTAKSNAKRKSRSPKKTWLRKCDDAPAPMDTLTAFYENISIASLMDARLDCTDRLQTHLSEEIAHTLVEKAVATNLAAKQCAYNLFDKPKETYTLCSKLSNHQLRTASVRSLDYEPTLRDICRNEKLRATQERRSSRFYHYLRSHCTNSGTFNVQQFDSACRVLQDTKASQSETIDEMSTEATI